jgi:hypothetical protein
MRRITLRMKAQLADDAVSIKGAQPEVEIIFN